MKIVSIMDGLNGKSTNLGSAETVVPPGKDCASSKRISVESDTANLGKGRGSSKRKSDTVDAMETSEPGRKGCGSRRNSLESEVPIRKGRGSSRKKSLDSHILDLMAAAVAAPAAKACGSSRRKSLDSVGSTMTDSTETVAGSSKRKSCSEVKSSAKAPKLSGNQPAVSGTYVRVYLCAFMKNLLKIRKAFLKLFLERNVQNSFKFVIRLIPFKDPVR